MGRFILGVDSVRKKLHLGSKEQDWLAPLQKLTSNLLERGLIMVQGSIKKFAKYLASVSAVLCVGLWVAGCTPKEEKKDDPLDVKGGELTKGGGSGYANETVTQANLEDFIDVFRSALDSYYRDGGYYSGSAPRGKRDDRPEEYYKGKHVAKGTSKIYGDSSGYVELAGEYGDEWQETSSVSAGANENGTATESATESATYKYFDFSNTNKLFLGGAVGGVSKSERKNDINTDTEKFNGTINFQGAYKGKVVFDNISNVLKYRYKEDNFDENWNWLGYDTISKDRKGSFYVESGGKKIDLPDSLIWEILVPSSNKGEDLGDDKMAINPAVPAAPNGTLTDRAGNNALVNADNVSEFFEAFNAEFNGNYNAPRAYENTYNTEKLLHGKVSGYYLRKNDEKRQVNSSKVYDVITATMSYNDYSNNGSLYFGGGFGEVVYDTKFYSNKPGKYTAIDTTKTTLNGKVHFNGDFNGTLDFQSFKYEETQEFEYEFYSGWWSGSSSSSIEYKLISGKVMIGSLDVTENYLEEVIRRN